MFIQHFFGILPIFPSGIPSFFQENIIEFYQQLKLVKFSGIFFWFLPNFVFWRVYVRTFFPGHIPRLPPEILSCNLSGNWSKDSPCSPLKFFSGNYSRILVVPFEIIEEILPGILGLFPAFFLGSKPKLFQGFLLFLFLSKSQSDYSRNSSRGSFGIIPKNAFGTIPEIVFGIFKKGPSWISKNFFPKFLPRNHAELSRRILLEVISRSSNRSSFPFFQGFVSEFFQQLL